MVIKKASSDPEGSSDSGSKSQKYTFMEVYGTIVAAFAFLCIGLLRAYTSPAISSMKNDPDIFNTTSIPPKDVISWVASAPPLASFIGTIISGPMLQYCGRQKTIVLLTIPLIAGWLLLGFAQDVIMILSGRLLTGLSAGISTAAAQLYVSECVRAEVRGTLGFLPAMMLALGVLLGFSASTFNVEWRQLALIMLSFPVLLLIMSITIPESPPWLLLRKREEDATNSLWRFRGKPSDLDEIDEEIRAMVESISKRKRRDSDIGGGGGADKQSFWKMIKQRKIWFSAFIAVCLMIFQQFSAANVVIYFLSVILTEAEPKLEENEIIKIDTDNDTITILSFNNSSSSLSTNVINSYHVLDHNVSSVIVGLVQFLAFFLSLPLIDRMGRKILLISSAVLMILPFALLGFYFFCNLNSEMNPDLEYFVRSTYSWLPLTCLCIFIAAYSIGFGPVPFLIMSEIFPSHARSYLCSLTSFTNHFALFVTIKTFPMFMESIGPHWTFWMFGMIIFGSIFFVVLCVPETKGKTLAEIEKQFSKKEILPLLNPRRDSQDFGLP